jgi:hypothetical protein
MARAGRNEPFARRKIIINLYLLGAGPILMASICLVSGPPAGGDDPAPARFRGTDFQGGAKDLFGSVHNGTAGVNYVYAAATGAPARMQAAFEVTRLPKDPVFVHLRACDDDAETVCPIAVRLNGSDLHRGPNNFPQDAFAWRRYGVPPGVLRAGRNDLVIANIASQGVLGMPPWFMVAEGAIAGEEFDGSARPPLDQEFFVILPGAERPVPEPLAEGQQPGFNLRGTKGWLWTADQYLEEVPVLARYKMNFLMICYGSMCDIEHYPWGDPQCNRWWEPLPEEKRKAYEELLRRCRESGIALCLSMNPNLHATRILDYASAADLEALWRHYAWMQALGMQWFCISLDDIQRGIDPAGQARLVNAVFGRLRASDPEARMIFCPTFYSGDGTGPDAKAYLEVLARDLDPEVYLFWTGDAVVTPVITRRAAESYRNVAKHRLILWDNYPVNDGNPTLHLGPVTGRDQDLCEILDGYMSNPMHKQNDLNRVPLITCADYAFNPRAYDPARSIGQAILHVADTEAGRQALKDLVELYPGMLIFAKGTAWNPAVARFNEILSTPHSHYLAVLYLRHVDDVSARLDAAFPNRFSAAKDTLNKNIDQMRAAFRVKFTR